MNNNYKNLYTSGELLNRVKIFNNKLANCALCPRNCGANRINGERGFCNSNDKILIASYCDHHGEEPAISGTNGSGTIFFANCNLKCIYCQNFQISQNKDLSNFKSWQPADLASCMIELQNKMVHNINFVSPSHYIAQIVEAVYLACAKGLNLPLVYNSNGYDNPESIKLLDNIIDIYLPDIKYASDVYARKYSVAKDYVVNARKSIIEMYKQTGNLALDKNGIAQKGLIIRLLVLPNEISETIDTLYWIKANLSTNVTISLMSQYFPSNKADKVPLLMRGINYNEYKKVEDKLLDLGFVNGWLQGMEAPDYYRPNFDTENHPFEKK
ncbi:MAG: radical SAM protein [bacterium]